MRSLTVRAFAKINLSLCVGDARPDGYHDVRTILQAIELFDTLKIVPRRGPFEIRSNVSSIPLDRTNLVWKAAELLWQAAGHDDPLRNAIVMLQKNIPIEAGLGGGSSNAAAALIALRRLWKLRVTDAEMFAIAARLGSDVPYFLIGGTALGLGRGEEVYPLEDLPRLPVVLAFPPFGVSTKDAYGWFDGTRDKRVRPLFSSGSDEHQKKRGLTPFPHLDLANDLEAPVIARHPLVGVVKQRLDQSGAMMAAMSGSGSTVFGVFTSNAAAAVAAKKLQKEGMRVLRTRFLPRRLPVRAAIV